MTERPPDQPTPAHVTEQQLQRERWDLLAEIDELTNRPMIVLSFVWLFLLILDFTVGASGWLQTLTYVIWGLFILDFLIELMIAPRKLVYLRRNWLSALSLVLPAFRIVRVFRTLRLLRAARATRSVSLVRLVTTVNRGIKAVRTTFGRRGFGYVLALTLVVTFAGAAGLNYFEGSTSPANASVTRANLNSYGEAVWWTAMIMTTLGSDFSPRTAEGRLLTVLLSLYALAIFGYVTAAIASFFVVQDSIAVKTNDDLASGNVNETDAMRSELRALRQELAELRRQLRLEPASSRLEDDDGS